MLLNIKESLFVTGFETWAGFRSKDDPTFRDRRFNYGIHKGFGGARIYASLARKLNGVVEAKFCSIDRDPASQHNITPVAFSPPLHSFWYLDNGYSEAKKLGIKTMLCIQGPFDNQILGADSKYDKEPPIDDGADRLSVESYRPSAEAFAQTVLRYGPTRDASKEHLFVHPTNPGFSTPSNSGQDTIWCFQWLNEAVPAYLTAYESGIGWAIAYHLGRQMSPTARLVAPSFYSATADKAKNLFEGFKDGCDQLGIEPAYDWHISFHRYHRVGNNGQDKNNAADLGASPESVNAFELFRSIVDVCDAHGAYPPMFTETGWGDDPTDQGKKQRAPIQDGYSLSESVGLLEFRNHLLALAAGCMLTCTFNIADNYGPSWNVRMGKSHGKDQNHPLFPGAERWSPKPSYDIIKELTDKYGHLFVPKIESLSVPYNFDGTTSVTVIDSDGNPDELIWSDKSPTGNVMPYPKLVSELSTQVEPDPDPKPPVDMVKLGTTDEGVVWFEPKV